MKTVTKPQPNKPQNPPRDLRAESESQHHERPQAQSSQTEAARSSRLSGSDPLPPELLEDVSASRTNSTTKTESATLDALIAEAEGAAQAAPAAFEPPLQVIPREAFRESFLGGFNFGGIFLPALQIAPNETAKAVAAADAIYDSALEVHWLRFLIEPETIWLQRAIAIGAFVGPKGVAVWKSLEAAKAAPRDKDESVTGTTTKVEGAPRDPETNSVTAG